MDEEVYDCKAEFKRMFNAKTVREQIIPRLQKIVDDSEGKYDAF